MVNLPETRFKSLCRVSGIKQLEIETQTKSEERLLESRKWTTESKSKEERERGSEREREREGLKRER